MGRVANCRRTDSGDRLASVPVVKSDAVQKEGQVSRAGQIVTIVSWGFKDDIVGLPFTGLATGVHPWWILTVDGTGEAIRA